MRNHDRAPMDAEFDTVARWTETLVMHMGPDYAIPAGCRGSGSPGALRWLGVAMGLTKSLPVLDDGGGVGGPSAFLAREFGIRPVLIEPMLGACSAAKNLFGLSVVAGSGEHLPIRDSSFSAALSLGVLCTTTHKSALLEELRRILTASGELGILAFVRTKEEFTQPVGNEFPTVDGLRRLLEGTGFSIIAEVPSEVYAPAPPDWMHKTAEIEDWLSRRYGADPRWALAATQQKLIESLLSDGTIAGHLIHARRH